MCHRAAPAAITALFPCCSLWDQKENKAMQFYFYSAQKMGDMLRKNFNSMKIQIRDFR
ncbi:hypothetical protein RSK20926_19227 [Roseobacter sp. SK209-2-6]|nr:hypothetical protein RSK20926_19227 [Roseobacter sp. SK209-2-6]